MQTFESPRDRVKEVLMMQITDASGPNVTFGIFLGAALQYGAGMVPWYWPIMAAVAWFAHLTVYSVVEEIKAELEEQKRRLLDPLDAQAPYGIE